MNNELSPNFENLAINSPWSMKVKYITYTVGKNTSIDSCCGIWLWIFPVAGLDKQVVKGEVSNVNPCMRSRDTIPGLSRAFKSFVHYQNIASVGR